MDSLCLLYPSTSSILSECSTFPVVESKRWRMPLGDGRSPRKLVDILRALPTGELDSLISRLGISIVAAKRIDTPSQVARALVSLPEVRDPSRLPNASAELLHRIAEARGSLL